MREKIRKRQHGLCACGCGEPLVKGWIANHTPPLELRPWDEEAADTIPPASDLAHIEGLTRECDRKQTYGPRAKATYLNFDRHAIDKNRRLRGETKGPKFKRAWPPRSMNKTGKARVRHIDRGE
jgi:hypothetical protein